MVRVIDISFLASDTGYVGVAATAYNALQEEDLVCIFHGYPIPAVLRPVGDQMYTLVTFVWVTGEMEGEFLDQPGWVAFTQDFVLC